jgi:hypothetical protein
MTQAFKIIDFNYDREDEWKYYFRYYIKNLAESCSRVQKIWEELRRKCNDMSYDKLVEDWDYSSILLGGVSEDGTYKERSLAKVYREIFGLKPENLPELIEKLRQKLPPTTKILVEETEFISFVRDVSKRVNMILEQAKEIGLISEWEAKIEVEYNYYEVLSDSEKLARMLSEFVQKLKEVLPNYNKRSLFIWTLDKLTYRYMTAAYPKLRNKESLTQLQNLFGLEVVFSPEIEGNIDEVRKKKEQYEVYAFRSQSLGRALVELYKAIWNAFDDGIRETLKLVFPEMANFKQEFYEMASEGLKNINWKFPNIKVVGRDPYYNGVRGDTTKAEYRISGIMLTSYRCEGYSTRGNYSSEEGECNIPLLQLLDELSPGLFLLHGLLFELDIRSGTLEVKTPSKRAVEAWK